MNDGSSEPRRAEFRLGGLDCPDCARGALATIDAIDGVFDASLSFASGLLVISYVDDEAYAEVLRSIRAMDYGVEPLGGDHPVGPPRASWRTRLIEPAIYLSGLLIASGWAATRAGLPEPVSLACSLAALLLTGGPVARRALVSLRSKVLDMNVLMSVAVLGALALGDHREAATVIFLFAIGGALESRSLARTRDSVRRLVALAPPTALVMRGESAEEVSLDRIGKGDRVLVRSGARVPVDGVVLSGSSAVDEAPITGESIPVVKTVGERVFAGSLNGSGALEVSVTGSGEDSTLAHIIRLVEDAQARKAPIEGMVERFTRWYTPAVVGLAAALAVVPSLLIALLGGDPAFTDWFYRALVLLVVSCPCALVISTPVAMVSAIARAARDGVLVKGGAHLEAAARIRVVAFDKTGTLTNGTPRVVAVEPVGDTSAEEVLAVAAALEANSAHPLARALSEASTGRTRSVEGFSEQPGRGVAGRIDGVGYVLGSPAYVADSGVDTTVMRSLIEAHESAGSTCVVLAESDSDSVLGVVAVADVVRESAAGAIRALRASRVEHVAMLTGDSERVARAVASSLGVDTVRAGLLPQDKSSAVSDLASRFGALAMVGDGINDAPALAEARIGIAMGAAGSDTALQTADVALMSDDLFAVAGFLDLGRRTVANIAQNVWFSVTVKFAVLVLAVFGYAPLWLAVFADTGVALLVILNGLRLLRPVRASRMLLSDSR